MTNARFDFLSEGTMGLGCVHGLDDTVEPVSFQALVCVVFEISLLT